MGAGLAELCEAASRTELVELITLQVRTVPDDGAETAGLGTPAPATRRS